MAEILEFPGQPDLENMTREQLEIRLAELRRQIEALDAREPEDMESDAYEDWGDTHEELEDQVDDILDLLDE